MSKLIVCLTGMPGAGKSTIAAGLKLRGYGIISMGDAVRREARRRGVEPSRGNLGKIMLELREDAGPGAIAKLITPQIESSPSGVILIDGIRSNEEIRVLRGLGRVRLLAVHASTDARFDFLQKRGRTDDPRTKTNFDERDRREMDVGISDSIALSDDAISNTGLTREELVETAYNIIQSWVDE